MRSREADKVLYQCFQDDCDILWSVFGVVGQVKVCPTSFVLNKNSRSLQPFTMLFPHADIHELLTPDLLRQLIKGAFKDHVVKWMEDWVKLPPRPARTAKKMLDDIDRRHSSFLSYLLCFLTLLQTGRCS
jgi:hypothetical protein